MVQERSTRVRHARTGRKASSLLLIGFTAVAVALPLRAVAVDPIAPVKPIPPVKDIPPAKDIPPVKPIPKVTVPANYKPPRCAGEDAKMCQSCERECYQSRCMPHGTDECMQPAGGPMRGEYAVCVQQMCSMRSGTVYGPPMHSRDEKRAFIRPDDFEPRPHPKCSCTSYQKRLQASR